MSYKTKFEQSLIENLIKSKKLGSKTEIKSIMIALKNKNPSFINKVLENNFNSLNKSSEISEIYKSAKLYSKLLTSEISNKNQQITFSKRLLSTDLKFRDNPNASKTINKVVKSPIIKKPPENVINVVSDKTDQTQKQIKHHLTQEIVTTNTLPKTDNIADSFTI